MKNSDWYSHLPRLSGIYGILNLVNGKIYIGQSKNIHDRGRAHLSFLKLGRNSRHLQRAWDRYGRNNFVIGVVDLCRAEELDQKEESWFIKTKSISREFGYNLENRSRGVKVFSPETLQHLSKLRTGRKHTLETRRKISEANKGQIVTEEQRKNLSEKMTGRKGSEEKKRKCSVASRGYFDNLTEEERKTRGENLSKKLKGKPRRALPKEAQDRQAEKLRQKKWFNNGKICARVNPTEQEALGPEWKPGRLKLKSKHNPLGL